MKSFFPQTTRDWDNRLDSLGSLLKCQMISSRFASLDPPLPVKSEMPLVNICFGVSAVNYLIRFWKTSAEYTGDGRAVSTGARFVKK